MVLFHKKWKKCNDIQLTKNKHFKILIRWFLTATSGTKPIIVSAGHVFYSLAKEREMRKYHLVWLQETGNSCTSVFPNTRAWKQQE